MQKRDLYLAAGVAEYWIVDAERRSVRVVRDDRADEVSTDVLRWHPSGAAEPLAIRLDVVWNC